MSLQYSIFLTLCLILGVSVHPGEAVPTPSETSPPPSRHRHNNHPISLLDIFNQRVNAQSEMCPRQNVVLFFLSRNIEYLRPCIGPELMSKWNGEFVTPAVPTAGPEMREGEAPSDQYARGVSPSRQTEATSYSGRLLKRILQNMNDGTAQVDNPPFLADQESVDKRARLSINSALTSLVDMLHQENERPRRPTYAFHSDLLRMG